MSIENPFRVGCKQYYDFNLMSDLQWHCTKCELQSSQAKVWQVWRQEKGIILDTDDNGNFYKKIYCPNCLVKTVHRKIKTLDSICKETICRLNLSNQIRKKVKDLYNNIDEYSLRIESSVILEIDHRIPQVRWVKDEEKHFDSMTDSELKEYFMLLTRENNLLKSRCCENCVRTNERAKGYKEIEFWYVGNKKYNPIIGCKGCFWYNPSEWRAELNKKILSIS